MSLFQCEHCGCCENTALAPHTKHMPEIYGWEGIEHLNGKELCSACGPKYFSDGTKTEYGEWHRQFDRIMLPEGKFKTNAKGDLEHIETGSIDFRKFNVNGCSS